LDIQDSLAFIKQVANYIEKDETFIKLQPLGEGNNHDIKLFTLDQKM